jgi:hypothetical protein
MNLTGLLIGAGASYCAGMPLVWELTNELKAWLTPDKLRTLNDTWSKHGSGSPSEVIDDVCQALTRLGIDGFHYENLLGYLETQFRRNRSHAQQYHHLYSWLVEIVYHILCIRHVKNVGYIERNLTAFDGLKSLAQNSLPLWVFSLNHDVILEAAAARLNLTLCTGFHDIGLELPRFDSLGRPIGVLKVEVLNEEQLNSGLRFLQPGTFGVNLLKIHGALDVFTFRDGKDLLKLLPETKSTQSIVEALRIANEELLWVENGQVFPRMTTNEIAYTDKSGEAQFLRRSLLAGAYKFDKTRDQVLPMQMLQHFKSNINYVNHLIAIGYGFGDGHVNGIVHDWLAFQATRKLEIVDPYIKGVPTFLSHLSAQVTITRKTSECYFDTVGGVVRTKQEANERRFAAWSRRTGSETAAQAIQGWMVERTKKRAENLVSKLATLPMKDGDIDLASLGMTIDELKAKVLDTEAAPTLEGELGEFLDRQEGVD